MSMHGRGSELDEKGHLDHADTKNVAEALLRSSETEVKRPENAGLVLGHRNEGVTTYLATLSSGDFRSVDNDPPEIQQLQARVLQKKEIN